MSYSIDKQYFYRLTLLIKQELSQLMNENMQLKRVAEAKLPTPFGEFLMVGFEEIATGRDHVALIFGDISGQSLFSVGSTRNA